MMKTEIPELVALMRIKAAVSGLSKSEMKRCAHWLSLYADSAPDVACAPTRPYATPSELFAIVSPKTGTQKLAVCAWWLERDEGHVAWRLADVKRLLLEAHVTTGDVESIVARDRRSEVSLIERMRGLTFRLSPAGFAYVEGHLA